MKNDFKTVGILGGMGPFATVAFYKKILELTPAKKDWEHLRIIIDNNPHIPSRSRHFLFGEESPLSGMIESCLRLQAYPVAFIVIPCNSASYYIPEVQKRLTVPLINIVDIASQAVVRLYPEASRIAVLGGTITYRKELYRPFLEKNDLTYIHHGEDIQNDVEMLIESIKLNKNLPSVRQEFRRLAEVLIDRWGAEAVILGCTEFGCIDSTDKDIAVVDSSLELAKYTVRAALTDSCR